MTLPLFPELCPCGLEPDACRFLPWWYGDDPCELSE